MRKNILTLFILFGLLKALSGQTDSLMNRFIDNGLTSLAGREGIRWNSRAGDFMFKPYTLIQTRGVFNYYDNEGLSLMEEDNILNSGFEIPYALIGFAGKAFNKITFNVALNPATGGGALLNQAWFDINTSDALRFRIGKFKTPFNQAFLVKNGETLFPILPASLTTRVNLPYSLNSVNPVLSTGFDIGVQMHGLLNQTIGYQLGVFNGTGISVNTAKNSIGDDNGLPSLLYSGRLTVTPDGPMPTHQGDPSKQSQKRWLMGVSGSYNVEANYESSNDLRAGAELAVLYNRWYATAEAYLLSMDFVERQQLAPVHTFWGAYGQLAWFFNRRMQLAARVDVFDRNSIDNKGLLLMPAIGFNYYLTGHNLKLQAMYQFLDKAGHENERAANDDDNSLAERKACLQLQFAF